MIPVRTAVWTVTVVSAAAVVWRHSSSPSRAIALASAVVVLGVLSEIDIRTFLLPNKIVGPFAVATFVWVVAVGVIEGDVGRAGVSVGVGVGWALVLLLLSARGHVGMGDVKLVVPVGMIAGWLGFEAVVISVVVSLASSGLIGLVLLIGTRSKERELSLIHI